MVEAVLHWGIYSPGAESLRSRKISFFQYAEKQLAAEESAAQQRAVSFIDEQVHKQIQA